MEAAGEELDAEDGPVALEPSLEAAEPDSHDPRTAAFEDDVHGRIRQVLLEMGRVAGEPPAHMPVVLHEGREVSRRLVEGELILRPARRRIEDAAGGVGRGIRHVAFLQYPVARPAIMLAMSLRGRETGGARRVAMASVA
jgi:hypothetical protein